MTRPPLPRAFLDVPIAHRALHDVAQGRPENSRAAVQAAVAAGFGIEIDLQLTRDGQVVVFHDYDLPRLTGRDGMVRDLDATDLARIPLTGGDGECIPTLPEILSLVAGKVPLLIEIKDQDGQMGPNTAGVEAATLAALTGYAGPLALMSFNPHTVTRLTELAPDIPRGLTTCSWPDAYWGWIAPARRDVLRGIPDVDTSGASFISHEAADLSRPEVLALKKRGVPVLCWTIRSPEAEHQARQIADNVTFEGYLPA